ncbi:hypothetical protein PVAND_000265 [Polypedilum vanderplanki]|uniref:Uncharacterized protein n=1 Tax=Polypedilum vanderplanki TaxID=319348 RepID=A0A9J6BJT4_POLVA|nr:hypothetical protein PVAND_000265 [Polypedilum vanderplanki]
MINVQKFLICMSLELGGQIIGWIHLLNILFWLIYFSYIGFYLITHTLALAMIYAILLLVVIFYMKLCVDLIIGVKKHDINRIACFRKTVMLTGVMLLLSLSWIILTVRKEAFPVPKISLIISNVIALLIEIYCYIVLDSLHQKIQDMLPPVTFICTPSTTSE